MKHRAILFSLLFLSLPLPAAADNTRTSVSSLVNAFNTTTLSSSAVFRLEADADFPCAVTLSETRQFEQTGWQKRYRFDLTDMETGILLRARDARRAIIYDSVKTEAGGKRHEYPPKKINFIGIDITNHGRNIQSLYDTAVESCRAKNDL